MHFALEILNAKTCRIWNCPSGCHVYVRRYFSCRCREQKSKGVAVEAMSDTIKAEDKGYGHGEVITAFCRHEAGETKHNSAVISDVAFWGRHV
jgi:hypothetical protein